MALRTKTLARTLTAIAIVASALIEPLFAATAAHAATAQSPSYFNREAVIGRAARWTRAGVRYSQTSWRDDYRTDCSGFISYAWGLDQSYVTWSLPKVAKRIAKEDLLPGDILLKERAHAVMFGGWTNKQHTRYRVYEQVGGSIRRAVSREVPYPYDGGGNYLPYRYTGGNNLYAPDAELPAPLVQTYAGGRPMAPSWAAKKNADRSAVAAKRAWERRNELHLKRRAEAAAKTERAAAETPLRQHASPAPVSALIGSMIVYMGG